MQTHQMKLASITMVLLLAIIGFSCKTPKTNFICIQLTKMNILYRGVDNPAKIVVSGISSKDMKVAIDNGAIKELNGSYLLNPAKLGDALVSVFIKDKLIGSETFRVKDLPDPIAKINGHKGGEVEKGWLLAAGGLSAELEGSDFDYKFMIVSFSVSVAKNGIELTTISNSDKFTDDQIKLLNMLSTGQKVYFENIKVMGPEGTTRNLHDIVFTIGK